MIRIFIFAIGLLFSLSRSEACTTFQIPHSSQKIVGKSYDWSRDSAHITIDKKNVAKKAFLIPLLQTGPAATWVSKHASITFNQYGMELPNGGMNDAGLVVEIMWLDESKVPGNSATPAVNELQWIQYMLDNYKTVQEMARGHDKIRVSRIHANVHYMACDATGECATFEYLEGKMVINGNGRNSIPTLTNNTYVQSLVAHKKFIDSMKPVPEKCVDSLTRFICATDYVQKFEMAANAVNHAFATLNRVWVDKSANNNKTVWNIIYEPAAAVKKVHLRTRAEKQVKTIIFAESEDKDKGYIASCKYPALVLDINSPKDGDVTGSFEDFTLENNKAMIKKAVSGDPALEKFVEIAGKYPQAPNLVCQDK